MYHFRTNICAFLPLLLLCVSVTLPLISTENGPVDTSVEDDTIVKTKRETTKEKEDIHDHQHHARPTLTKANVDQISTDDLKN